MGVPKRNEMITHGSSFQRKKTSNFLLGFRLLKLFSIRNYLIMLVSQQGKDVFLNFRHQFAFSFSWQISPLLNASYLKKKKKLVSAARKFFSILLSLKQYISICTQTCKPLLTGSIIRSTFYINCTDILVSELNF